MNSGEAKHCGSADEQGKQLCVRARCTWWPTAVWRWNGADDAALVTSLRHSAFEHVSGALPLLHTNEAIAEKWRPLEEQNNTAHRTTSQIPRS